MVTFYVGLPFLFQILQNILILQVNELLYILHLFRLLCTCNLLYGFTAYPLYIVLSAHFSIYA